MTVKDLKPARVWQIFDEITQVPRPSGRLAKIQAWLVDFAKKNNLEYKVDEVGNVAMFRPAAPGFENAKGVVLQGHMDMVAEKAASSNHDFDNDPIETIVDGEWVRANNTTLGADDGMGLAIALAAITDPDIKCGPMEALATVDEETGLTGASNIKADMLRGDYLLNLDSEDDGVITVGCAGGLVSIFKFDYKEEDAPKDLVYFQINFAKFHGGHSGTDINKGFASATKLITRLLCTMGIDYRAEVKNEYHVTEKCFEMECKSVDAPAKVVDDCTAKRVITAVFAAPHGVASMSMEIEGLVETSTNLASIKMRDGKFVVEAFSRSAVESRKMELVAQIEAVMRLAGANEVLREGSYQGWEPRMDSALLHLAVASWEKLYGVKPVVEAIHAGLECGLFLQAAPHMEMISYGPTLQDVHSPAERCHIPAVQKGWDFTVELLKEIAAGK